MDRRERRIKTARILGNVALVVGILITAIFLSTDSTPVKGLFFAGLLVITGLSLRWKRLFWIAADALDG